VLCLASGGGQQSVAFALLGAEVTVLDIAEGQLERDRQAAEHYGVALKTIQGDMRDLSSLAATSFDIVYHPYSLNFVPDARVVFREVARVQSEGGLYYLHCANPFFCGLTPQDWNGNGYTLKYPYGEGVAIESEDQPWAYSRSDQTGKLIPTLREYRHTLGTLLNGLIEAGFVIRHLSEGLSLHPDLEAEPGTWDHFVAYAPPWFALWTEYHSPFA
jgi:ubiquinone/menaquinone biosynthesis C-methylase UbiE